MTAEKTQVCSVNIQKNLKYNETPDDKKHII